MNFIFHDRIGEHSDVLMEEIIGTTIYKHSHHANLAPQT